MNKFCNNCKYSRLIYSNGQWAFIGCCHEPYHGKLVREIEECPIQGEEECPAQDKEDE